MHISSLQFGQCESLWKHHLGFLYASTEVPTASLTWASIPQPCLSGGRMARLWLHSCSNSDSQRWCLRNPGRLQSSLPSGQSPEGLHVGFRTHESSLRAYLKGHVIWVLLPYWSVVITQDLIYQNNCSQKWVFSSRSVRTLSQEHKDPEIRGYRLLE